jgi:hypothetical protein
VHEPGPEQAPLQPVNVDPAAGVAASERVAPDVNACEHASGHEIPAGVLATEPEPEPTTDTVNVWVATVAVVNVAVTLWSALIVTEHEPVPEQAPVQPVNVDPAAGVAASDTEVPAANACEQLPGHEIPAGVLVTEPEPEPAADSVNVCVSTVVLNVAWLPKAEPEALEASARKQ